MTGPLKKLATAADLAALPDNIVGEIIDGELYASPRPAFPHANAHTAIIGELNSPFRRGRGGPGGWVLLTEPELHLSGSVVVPDIAGWRRERLPEVPDAKWLPLEPDWLCECLSPSTMKLDRAKKLPLYAAEKVQHVWLVDAIEKTLEIFRLDGETYRLVATFADDAMIRAEPFDAIELELGVLWQR